MSPRVTARRTSISTSDAGGDSSDAAKDAGSDGACPSGMVTIPDAGYCIDSTEVTRTSYAAFLASNPSTSTQLPECSWNASFIPTTWDTSQGSLPVVYVDWCDAYAYCKWDGKRMCGKIGGGPLPFSMATDPTASQWYRACSANGGLPYPYGNSYAAGTCNAAVPDASIAPVGGFSQCLGGYPGLFDMSGNVEEWQDSCDGTSGATDNCRDQAGAFDYSSGDPVGSTRCDFLDSDTRSAHYHDVGIRCCAP